MSIQIRVAGLFASAIVASAATAQTAVEWKVSEGGNGHWYQFVRDYSSGICWSTARSASTAAQGHLATITSAAENAFLTQLVQAQSHVGIEAGPFLGGTCEGRAWGDWVWVTGEQFSFTAWNPGEPNSGGGERYLHMWRWEGGLGWNDTLNCNPGHYSYLIEWESDCNADGIVDYGQIVRGELDDDNANGIPDVCETSVTGVVPPSVPSQGGATVTIKGANFPENPTVLVGGLPATNAVRLSATRITATSPALAPGMTSITVNGYTLADAIYIRPECGSDLDQNGSVDAGDISIILLDFGPCYEPPAALAAPAPTPLLADEPAQKTGTTKKH